MHVAARGREDMHECLRGSWRGPARPAPARRGRIPDANPPRGASLGRRQDSPPACDADTSGNIAADKITAAAAVARRGNPAALDPCIISRASHLSPLPSYPAACTGMDFFVLHAHEPLSSVRGRAKQKNADSDSLPKTGSEEPPRLST